MSTGRFAEGTFRIAAELARDAVWFEGRCNWVARDHDGRLGRPTECLRALGPDFYGGVAGIGAFLAVAYRLTDEVIFARTALGALRNARDRALRSAPDRSFLTGTMGVAHAATFGADLPGTDVGLEEALAVARHASAERPRGHDVVTGAAGSIVASLHLYDRTDATECLDAATECGRFLVDEAVRGGDGVSWPTSDGCTGLTGYAHGNAGIAAALWELNRCTGEEVFAETAREAVVFERRHFAPEQSNWLDLRPWASSRGRVCGTAWCHGAPGIALARTRAYALTGDEDLAADARLACGTTAAAIRRDLATEGASASLCHGLAGNAEVLLVAGDDALDPTDRALVETVAERLDPCREPTPSWKSGLMSGSPTVSLFLGSAGVGWYLARVSDPIGTPSPFAVFEGETASRVAASTAPVASTA